MLTHNFDHIVQQIRHLSGILPEEIAQESVNLFQENFRIQGFFVANTWKERKDKSDTKRGILIGKGSGAKLWRSLRYEITLTGITIIADRPYAAVHNEGFKGVQYIKQHTVESHKRQQKTTRGIKNVTVKRHQRGASARRVNITQRQFLGNHPVYRKHIIEFIEKLINSTT
jgi:phage gpG-like protein